ncbi:MAG: sulfite exporter TauE/SafE family protein, partial [Novosphingobium sp.]
MDPATILAAIAAGSAIGLVLALVGGGGSILAVPLLVYLVGVESPHAAIGTAAVAVALNAASSLAGHARSGNVKWPCAGTFALAGVIGAALGAEAGKAMDGQRLLALFGALMMLVGLSMLRPR